MQGQNWSLHQCKKKLRKKLKNKKEMQGQNSGLRQCKKKLRKKLKEKKKCRGKIGVRVTGE
jgi:hypothetical protein